MKAGANELREVEDGEECMDYLNCRGRYSDLDAAPRPGANSLDLNSPRKHGRRALGEIEAARWLRRIPIVSWCQHSQDEQGIINSSGRESVRLSPSAVAGSRAG